MCCFYLIFKALRQRSYDKYISLLNNKLIYVTVYPPASYTWYFSELIPYSELSDELESHITLVWNYPDDSNYLLDL